MHSLSAPKLVCAWKKPWPAGIGQGLHQGLVTSWSQDAAGVFIRIPGLWRVSLSPQLRYCVPKAVQSSS